jgi:hypothetical protein
VLLESTLAEKRGRGIAGDTVSKKQPSGEVVEPKKASPPRTSTNRMSFAALKKASRRFFGIKKSSGKKACASGRFCRIKKFQVVEP